MKNILVYRFKIYHFYLKLTFDVTCEVPPSSLNIIDEDGQETKTLVGPYQLSTTTRLRCLSSGGKDIFSFAPDSFK